MAEYICQSCLEEIETRDYHTPKYILRKCGRCGWERHLNVSLPERIIKNIVDFSSLAEEEKERILSLS